MKVYCKNCKWFKCEKDSCNINWENCYLRFNKKRIVNIDSITGIKSVEYSYESPRNLIKFNNTISRNDYHRILNRNNNCKYYKRKWYKFWVKDK